MEELRSVPQQDIRRTGKQICRGAENCARHLIPSQGHDHSTLFSAARLISRKLQLFVTFLPGNPSMTLSPSAKLPGCSVKPSHLPPPFLPDSTLYDTPFTHGSPWDTKVACNLPLPNHLIFCPLCLFITDINSSLFFRTLLPTPFPKILSLNKNQVVFS